MSITVKKNYLTNNDCYKSGRTITPNSMELHTIGTAQNTAASLASYWNQSGIQACVQYCIDAEQESLVYQFLPDNRRPWADAGYGNNNSIAVELMESDYMKYTGGANYTVTNEAKFKADVTRAYNTAVQFFAMKCKEYGWNPQEKMSNGLHRVYSHDEARKLRLASSHVDPTHIWNRYGWTMDQFRADVAKAMKGVTVTAPAPTTNKSSEPEMYRIRKTWADSASQVGAYQNLDNAIKACPNGYKVYNNAGKAVYSPATRNVTVDNMTATDLSGLSEAQKVAKVAPIYQAVMKKTGMLASVGLAQFCLESGYATTDLAINANNFHGMKCSLSGNSWSGSTWDGTSKYTKTTAEQTTSGSVYYVKADFRKYPSIMKSVEDRAAYFIGAWKDSAKTIKRYPGINLITNAEAQIKLIKSGGYATDVNYVSKLMSLVTRFNLTQYDKGITPEVWTKAKEPTVNPTVAKNATTTPNVKDKYHVGTSIKNGVVQGRIGAFSILDNAKKMAASNGMKVYDVTTGKQIWPTVIAEPVALKYYRVATGYSSGNYIGQIGAFTDKDNAIKAAKAAGKQYKVYDPYSMVVYQQTTAPTASKPSLSAQVVTAANDMNAIMMADVKAGKKWVYYNSGQKKTFDIARSSGVYRCNCNLGVIWAFKRAGVLPADIGNFYGSKGKIRCSATVKNQLLKKFDLLDFGGKRTAAQLVASGDLRAGDIVTYTNMTHTNMCLGGTQFFDSGHAWCDKSSGNGARFSKWIGNDPYASQPVGQVLRLKENSKMYRVRVGRYSIEDNAINMMSTVKLRAGLDCFKEKKNGEFVVYCGSFNSFSGASERVLKLAQANIPAEIDEV